MLTMKDGKYYLKINDIVKPMMKHEMSRAVYAQVANHIDKIINLVLL